MIRVVESVHDVLVTVEPQEGRGNKREKVGESYIQETEIGNPRPSSWTYKHLAFVSYEEKK